MSDIEKALIGSWSVAFNQFRWTYTFEEARPPKGGKVKWTDAGSGKSGTGTWTPGPTSVTVEWDKSSTKETWNLPINPADQKGQVTSDYANGWFSATKDGHHKFDGFAPEGQMDAFACWAACLAWFTKVSPDVPTLSQMAVMGSADPKQWAPTGAITIEGLMRVDLRGVNLKRARISAGDLPARVAAREFPMLIGFASGPLGGHVNVIHSFDDATQTVGVMEPWSPAPENNKQYEYDSTAMAFLHKQTHLPFAFKGAMVSRPLSYYTSKPLNGQFVIASKA